MTPTPARASLSTSLPDVAATAVGSFPGVDVAEVAAIVRGELAEFPLLPELPARGPGADMIGRTASMLTNLSSAFACQTTPSGWRITGSVSGAQPRAMRFGSAWLSEDLDAVEEAFEGYEGPFKVQMTGPWTMAAVVESPNGERLLADLGARKDLGSALAEAASIYVSEVGRRIPNAQIVLQFDEPLLDRVLAGSVVRQSGFGAIDPVDSGLVVASLSQVFDEVRRRALAVGVHSCAADLPTESISRAKPDFISLDLARIERLPEADRREAEGVLAGYLESGNVMFAGLAFTSGDPRSTLRPLTDFLSRTGLSEEELQRNLVLTPTCGLAGEPTLGSVRAVLAHVNEGCLALRGKSVQQDRGFE